MMRSIMPTATEIAAARRRLHRKAVSIVGLLAAGYALLVFADVALWLRAVAAVAVVHACIAAATGIMHDANHAAFAASARWNRALSYVADLLGASSALWKRQHNDLHHRHTNVMGHDTDIEQSPIARLAPEQPWHPWHRAQHVYMWPLYGFLTVQWLLVSDFLTMRTHRIGSQPIPPLTRSASIKLVVGKLVHVGWAVALPMQFHAWWTVLLVYLACSWAVGFALSIIFQLAHCVDVADFVPDEGRTFRGDDNVRHQLATTVDIGARTRLGRSYMAWLMGGLDHQVEHHLAPRLPHTIYASLAERVDEMCAANGLHRRRHASLGAALASHTRWLRQMGRSPRA